jgi:hypothetical protein
MRDIAGGSHAVALLPTPGASHDRLDCTGIGCNPIAQDLTAWPTFDRVCEHLGEGNMHRWLQAPRGSLNSVVPPHHASSADPAKARQSLTGGYAYVEATAGAGILTLLVPANEALHKVSFIEPIIRGQIVGQCAIAVSSVHCPAFSPNGPPPTMSVRGG